MSTSARSFKLPPHLSCRQGSLRIEGVPVEKIARAVGTPAYIYSAASIRRRFSALSGALRPRDHLICYAMKANSNRSVCRILARLGAGADVVSGGELRRALGAGFSPGRIIFSGVGKTAEEVAFALKAGVFALNVESQEELELVVRVARRLQRRAPVSVRVNPDIDAGTHGHVTTGRADNKFGVEPGLAASMLRRARRDPGLKPVGLQCHLGSQIVRVGPYQRALETLLTLVSKLSAEGISLEFIDIGGGMGITGGNGRHPQAPFPLSDWARRILKMLKPWPSLKLLVEPGRFLVADSGILAARILYRKQSSRSRFVVVDAGMNDLIRPALYGARHPIVPARPSGGKRVSTDVVGPVCETSDCFARGISLPWPKPGDIWAMLQAGAYGFSMSSQYNSRLRPVEVLVEGEKYRIVRQRERYEDLVRLETGK